MYATNVSVVVLTKWFRLSHNVWNFQTLQKLSPIVKPEECKSGALAENKEKNRFADILPGN